MVRHHLLGKKSHLPSHRAELQCLRNHQANLLVGLTFPMDVRGFMFLVSPSVPRDPWEAQWERVLDADGIDAKFAKMNLTGTRRGGVQWWDPLQCPSLFCSLHGQERLGMNGSGGVAMGPGGRFRKRFLLFLKVGTRTVLPTKVHLHDRKNFTAADMEELIGMVEKHVITKYVRRVAARQGDLVFAEMKNTTKKERQEFSARCTPFKRSSCVSGSLRFGYYFHEEPYGQPVVLTPLMDREESDSVLIDLVEQETIQKMLMEELGMAAKQKRPSSKERAATADAGQRDIAAMMPASASGKKGNGVSNGSSGNQGAKANVKPKKGAKQLSLVDLVTKKKESKEEGGEEGGTDNPRETGGDGGSDGEGDDIMSSQEELALLLEVGKDDDTPDDEGEVVEVAPPYANVEETAQQPMAHIVDDGSSTTHPARVPTISLIDDKDGDFLSPSPIVAAMEEHERAVTIDMSGKGQRRWKEMRALPYTLMIFTRPNTGQLPTAAMRTKSSTAEARPPPISISSYFGIGLSPSLSPLLSLSPFLSFAVNLSLSLSLSLSI